MAQNLYGKNRLGIIKGGQLGRMLIQDLLKYDIKTFVLDDDTDAPCKACCNEFFAGDPGDFKTLYRFGKKVDLLTIEFEHVNTDALEKLQKEGLAIFPSPEILKMIQDKGLQKEFYKNHGIPTADFMLIKNKKELSGKLLKHADLLPAVQKTRKAGYDGKGVVQLKTASDLSRAFDAPSVLEKKIDFTKEIAVIVARNAAGEMATYPVVELEFHPQKNLVEFLSAPAKISKKTATQGLKIAKKIASTLKIVGLLAVEMFVLKNGKVLVNEIAPRPHNSGHHTIEANLTSQFEQHFRAIYGLPLGSTKMRSPAAMINLLGEEGHEGPVKYQGLEKVMVMEGVFVHLYGKAKTKPYRKMGHVTILAKNIAQAKQKAILVKQTLKVISK